MHFLQPSIQDLILESAVNCKNLYIPAFHMPTANQRAVRPGCTTCKAL